MSKGENSEGVRALAVVALACTGQFMVVLDVSVVNVALPTIRAALGFDDAALQWVINAYALTFAGFLLLGGRIADLYGRRRVFIAGLALFSASSLVGGLASDPGALVAARAVQGMGAAILAPATLTILTTTFTEGTRRNRALAIWTVIGVAGGAVGNVIGGGLTEFLSWRWIILINVPIGALAILVSFPSLGKDRELDLPRRLDVPGAVLATVGLSLLTYAVTLIQLRGLGDPVFASTLALAVFVLAGFVLIEWRFARVPLMPLRLLRVRSISIGNIVMLLAGACFMPMWYFLTLFMQNVLGYGPLQTGFGFLPHALVTIVVGVWITPRLMDYVEGRILISIGSVFAAVGFLWQSFATAGSDYVSGILGPAVVMSIGGGLLNTPITTTVTSGVSDSEAGAASGLMNTAKQAGGALGLAALVAVAASVVQTPTALAADYGRAFLSIAAILVVVATVSLALPERNKNFGH